MPDFPPQGGTPSGNVRNVLTLPLHHTNYGTEVIDEEFFRYSLRDDERAEVWRLNVSMKDNPQSLTNLTVDIYDDTEGRVLCETFDNLRADGEPLGVSSTGCELTGRLTNQTGGPRDAAVGGVILIVPA